MATRMKGTFLFNMGTGGFSESLYAVDNTDMTYQQMMNVMKQLLPQRCSLSVTENNPYVSPAGIVLNPLKLYAIRVEDELKTKDALTEFVPTPPGYNIPGPLPNAIFLQNLYQNQCAKIQWNGQAQGAQAVTYIHGIPVVAADDDYTDVKSLSELHNTPMSSLWLSNLRTYAKAIRQYGVGFRYLTSPWDPPGGGPGPMNTPTSIAYNATKEMYEITMPQVFATNKFRVVIRGMKSLNFLNGRWPALQLFTPAAIIQVQRRARQVTWDNNGIVSPEVWSYFKPNETIPADPSLLPGAKYFFITEKKIGRPFGVPRGRVRVRPT